MHYNILNTDALERIIVLAQHIKGYKNRKYFINDNVKALEKLTQKDSNNLGAWYDLSQSYSFQKTYNLRDNNHRIEKCLYRCIELDSLNGHYYYELSFVLSGERKTNVLKQAIKLNEYWLYREHLIVHYYRNMKDYVAALKLISETLEIYLNYSKINNHFIGNLYSSQAIAYKGLKKYEKAKESIILRDNYIKKSRQGL